MKDTLDAILPPLDHNMPPLQSGKELRRNLEAEYAGLSSRLEEILRAGERMPATVDNDDVAGRAADFIKQITALAKAAEAARVATKQPYLDAGNTCDGYFKAIIKPLTDCKHIVESRLSAYLRKKAEAERRRREEEERIAREQREKLRREAEEAERKMRDERDLQKAIEAQRLADQAAAQHSKAERRVEAKPADMARTRGDYGGLASLREYWDFDQLDRATLDLEALRNHIPLDGLERAVRSYIKAGGRVLVGCNIFKNTDAVVG